MAASRSKPCTASAIAPARPAMMVDGELHGRVDARARSRELAAEWGVHAHERRAVTVYVPGDAGALSLGAEARGQRASRREAGTRGRAGAHRAQRLARPVLARAAGRSGDARGPRRLWPGESPATCPSCSTRACWTAAPHALRLGDIETHRLARAASSGSPARGSASSIPASIDDYIAHGGYAGLSAALTMPPAEIVRADHGVRACAAAAARRFPPASSGRRCTISRRAQKYIACNADEGDSGTFSDRMLMEGDPFALIEGMTIAALAVGATAGLHLPARGVSARGARAARGAARWRASAVISGANLRDSGRDFDISVRLGAGAYICGEETSMLESLEGRRGEVRVRPPLPAIKGLFGQPTVVNNVVTLATVPVILARGAQFYQRFRHGQVARHDAAAARRQREARRPGGARVRAHGESSWCTTTAAARPRGRPVRAVQIGGPLGAYLPEIQFDTPLDYEALAAKDALARPRRRRGVRRHRRHGAHGALRAGVLRRRILRQVHAVPHRLDARRRAGGPDPGERAMERARATWRCSKSSATRCSNGSLCGLGGMTPFPVRSALKHFDDRRISD